MPKFSNVERILVKSIVAALSLKRIPEKEIMEEIYRQTNKTLTQSGLFYVKQAIKKESYHWLKSMRQDQYAYVHEFKERINEILNLQKRHHEIVDSPTVPISIKQTSLAELHKLNITLSNYFDVMPTVLNDIAIPAPSESENTATETKRNFIV